MNNIKLKWKFKKGKAGTVSLFPGSGSAGEESKLSPVFPAMSDARLELLGQRYQANHICYLLDITFEVYLLAAKGWDRIAKYLDDGGGLPVRGTQTGCRMVNGQLVIDESVKACAGECACCGRWWSERSGGLNESDLCPVCVRRTGRPECVWNFDGAVKHA